MPKRRLVRCFQDALALPTANYLPLEDLRDNPGIVLVNMDSTGITRAKSAWPVIGTGGIGPCLAVILDNRPAKKAVVHHNYPECFSSDFRGMVPHARESDAEPLRLHLVGRSLTDEGVHAQRLNAAVQDELVAIVEFALQYPNIEIVTFDVAFKRKPAAVGIDTRNGRLIRATNLFSYIDEIEEVERGYPTTDDFPVDAQPEKFFDTATFNPDEP